MTSSNRHSDQLGSSWCLYLLHLHRSLWSVDLDLRLLRLHQSRGCSCLRLQKNSASLSRGHDWQDGRSGGCSWSHHQNWISTRLLNQNWLIGLRTRGQEQRCTAGTGNHTAGIEHKLLRRCTGLGCDRCRHGGHRHYRSWCIS